MRASSMGGIAQALGVKNAQAMTVKAAPTKGFDHIMSHGPLPPRVSGVSQGAHKGLASVRRMRIAFDIACC